MGKYMLRISGRNFLVDMDDSGEAKHGFLTFRFVEASDASVAETVAIEQVRTNSHLRSVVRNPAEDPPHMVVEEIDELESFADVPPHELGFIWYPEDEQEEDLQPPHQGSWWRRLLGR